MPFPRSVAELTGALRESGYLADRGLATALYVGLTLDRPILIEGEVGVGKTEVAKTLAAVLAMIGLYGVMSYNVVRRSNEIGIRMALGAKREEVLWMVLRETVALLVVGIAIGVPVTLAATRLVASQLFGLTSFDLVTITMAVVTIAVVTIIAGYLPARRGTKVDPLVALRYE